MSNETEKACPDCREMFCPEEEGMWVRTSRRHGKEVCSSCSYEYEYECGLCGESTPKDPEANDAGSDVFVMWRRCSALGGTPLKRGFYRILRGPFFGGPLIGEPYFFEDHIEWLASVPHVKRRTEYACTPICEDCQRRYLGCVRHWKRKAA